MGSRRQTSSARRRTSRSSSAPPTPTATAWDRPADSTFRRRATSRDRSRNSTRFATWRWTCRCSRTSARPVPRGAAGSFIRLSTTAGRPRGRRRKALVSQRFPGLSPRFHRLPDAAVAGRTPSASPIRPTPTRPQLGKTDRDGRAPGGLGAEAASAVRQPVLRIQPDGSAFIDVTVPAGSGSDRPGIDDALRLRHSGQSNAAEPTVRDRHPPHGLSIAVPIVQPRTARLVGHALHTFCTAADTQKYGTASASYSLSAVGFDYPAFEASYPQSAAAAPAITNGDGHHGQADITTANPHVASNVPAPMNGRLARPLRARCRARPRRSDRVFRRHDVGMPAPTPSPTGASVPVDQAARGTTMLALGAIKTIDYYGASCAPAFSVVREAPSRSRRAAPSRRRRRRSRPT